MNDHECKTTSDKYAQSCASSDTPLDNLTDFPSDGASQDKQSELLTTSNIPKTESKKERKANVPGMMIGALIILIGFIIVARAGTNITETTFGADFYTYTYEGIVTIAKILASIEQAIGWLVVSIGAAIEVMSMKH